MGDDRLQVILIREAGRFAEATDDARCRHGGSASRIAGGHGGSDASLPLQVPHLHRADEVRRQLGRGQAGAIPFLARLGFLLEAAVDHQVHRLRLGHRAGVDSDIDHRVDDRPQVELPVDQHQGRIVDLVAQVHHDLGHVDGPAFDEDATAEYSPRQRRAAIRVDELEVVAGRPFVDRRQVDLAVVLLGQIRVHLVGRPVVGRRGHEVERLLAFVERARRVEHRAGELAKEGRCPVDLERLVGDGDDVVAPAELDDAAVALAAVPHEVGGGVMSPTDCGGDDADRP